MENKPFKDLALAQEAVFKVLQMTSVEAPSSIIEIYDAIKHEPFVRNIQQVTDYVKRLNVLKQVARIREGKAYKYWLVDTNAKMPPTGKKAKLKTAKPEKQIKVLTAPTEAILLRPIDVPQIKITDSLITITHSKYKLTLELA